MAKYHVSKNTPSEIKEAITMLESRGIRIYSCYSFCYFIRGRLSEHNLILHTNQIINKDDIPETCEVVYYYIDLDNKEVVSHDDPVYYRQRFIPIIFVKKNRDKRDALYGFEHGVAKANNYN